MAKKNREVTVELLSEDDAGNKVPTKYKLRFGHNAVAEFEEVTKMDFVELTTHPERFQKIGIQRAMLYVAMHSVNPLISQEQVGELMDEHIASGGDRDAYVQALTDALTASGVFIVRKVTKTGEPAGASPKDEAPAA